ncbi:MAG: hypothetical protein A2Y41_04565 [Spirochaetes bacterium GWB1_36_13]|nr:MAG: hypothetical protein A2Y41_04565 [Spirochaetes bacterium GWB1_36_13]
MKKTLLGLVLIISLFGCINKQNTDYIKGSDTTGPTLPAIPRLSGFKISTTGFTLSWQAALDNLSFSGNMLYKVVVSTADNLNTVLNSEQYGTVKKDWTAGITSAEITGLEADTSYYANVLVKDQSGNKSIYQKSKVKTLGSTAAGYSPSLSNSVPTIPDSTLTQTALTLNWTAAADTETTNSATLSYKVIRSAIPITGLSDLSSGTEVMTYTANTTTFSDSGLSAGTSYYYAVVVKDTDGNESLYTVKEVKTLTSDSTAPVVSTPTLGTTTPTETNVTVSWTAATDTETAASNLKYKVYYSTSNNMTTSADAKQNGTPAMSEWVAGITSYPVTGLLPGAQYYITVVARDEGGNETVYTTQTLTTKTDTTAPVLPAVSTLTEGTVTSSSAEISWSPATDNANTAAQISYKVVKAASAGLIDTVAEADAITGTDLVMDYTAGTTSATATGLNHSTDYYFAVIAKDSSANKSIYQTKKITTPVSTDTTAPVISTSTLSSSSVSSTGFTVSWTAATDTDTNLQYLVYTSTSDNISTVADAEANGTAFGSYEPGITSKTITGLTASTTYYYTVIVKDSAGNKSIYTKNSVTTSSASSGGIDTSFNSGGSGTGGTVNSIAVQTDGKILVGGYFTSYNETFQERIIRLNTDGTLDTAFNSGGAGASNTVYSIALQADSKILIGGEFNSYNATSQMRIARLNTDGTLDTAFNSGGAGANGYIYSIAVQADSKILIGGDFTTFNGTSQGRIARLNADGTLDASFNSGGAGAGNNVRFIAVQTDGKILIGGGFSSYNATSQGYIARLNTDGTLDTAFNSGGAGANGDINSIVLQSDGKILIGGGFYSYNATSQMRIARLNTDGTLDTAFNSGGAGADNIIYSIALQTDSKILIGGSLTSYNNNTLARIARLNTDGSLDTSFNSGEGFNQSLYSIAVQADGKILIGGQFSPYHIVRFFQ